MAAQHRDPVAAQEDHRHYYPIDAHLEPVEQVAPVQDDHPHPSPTDAHLEPVDLLDPAGVSARAAHAYLDQLPSTGNAVLVHMNEVQPESLRWLWPGRIPLGKITILDGDPGTAKSLLTLDLAARVSRGDALPDGTRADLPGPAGVVLLSAEDSLAQTIRPRLDAAGADVDRIFSLEAIRARDGGSRLPTVDDIDIMRLAIAATQAALVVFDPLMAYLGVDVNAHRDQDVRRVLYPLSVLAAATGVAVLIVRHLNKASGGSALYRGGGSIGLAGAARSVLLLARDPDDPASARRILAVTKANLAALAPAYAFRVAAEGDVPRIAWEGPTRHTADALLALPAASDTPLLDEAADFLRDFLAEGPQPARAVAEAALDAGHSEDTLRRARWRLGVRVEKQRGVRHGQWVWRLPGPPPGQPAQDGHLPGSGGGDPLDRGQGGQPAQDGHL